MELSKSPVKGKRLRVIYDDRIYDFGLDVGETYIDHHDKKLRDNYIKRHMGNHKEAELIRTLTPSPALFAMMLLWGPYPTLEENFTYLNKLLHYRK